MPGSTEGGAQGQGQSLGKIAITAYYIDKIDPDHDLLKALHNVCYGDMGKDGQRKQQLRKFNGFGESQDTTKLEKQFESSNEWTVACLKDLCDFLDIDGSGKERSALIKRVAAFLVKPYSTDRTTYEKSHSRKGRSESKKKRSRSSRSSSKSSSSKSPSRSKRARVDDPPAKSAKKQTKPKSAKFLYIQDRKDAAKAENPDMDSTALAMKLIAEYKALPADKKAKYKARAEEEKKAFQEAQALLAEMEEMGDLGM